jgi:hypothetical protein
VCDQETSKTRRLKPATGLWKIQPRWVVTPGKQTTNKQVTPTSRQAVLMRNKNETVGKAVKSHMPHAAQQRRSTTSFASLPDMHPEKKSVLNGADQVKVKVR